jgi:membrane-bound lytic murein transglycosylase D
MNVSYHVDERKDPFKSTVAAAKLLKLNYQELKSWPLAITAYNHGAESMKRASAIFKTTDLGVIIENYRDRRFRFASKNFYSCFLAASEIAANPEQYFTDLIYHTPIQYNEIVLLSQFKPAILAGRLGISQDELARWNPALLPSIFRHQGNIPRGFRLRIPPGLTPEMAALKIASAQSIPKILDKASSAADTDKTDTKDYQYYTVSEGDTLYGIAQYFGISMDAILAVNDIERENRLSIGQVLRIPVKK